MLANYSAEIHAIVRIQWGLIFMLMLCTGWAMLLYITERMERRRATGYLRQARRELLKQQEKIASLEKQTKSAPVLKVVTSAPAAVAAVASTKD